MAGRKKPLPMYKPPKDINTIEDVILRDMAFKTKQSTPYCKHCGQVIVESEQDANGFNTDFEWEIKNLTHYKCLKKYQAEMETQASVARAEEERKRAEEAANFDWDAYMKEMLDKKE